MDKISVIVPVYKVEQYLNDCVNSIVNQTYTNLEIILVDDGSPDNCPKMCDDWAKKDSRIKVVHKENGGLSDARNAGLNVVTGDYFVFVDSDDFVHVDYIKNLKNGIDKFDADLALSSHVRFIDVISEYNNEIDYTYHDRYEAFKRLVNWHKDYVVAWGKLYKTSVYGDLRFIKGKINEDEFYINNVYMLSKRIAYINAQTYFYRVNPNSIMESNYSSKRINAIEALEYRDDVLTGLGYTEFLDNNRRSLLFLIICTYYEAKGAGYKQDAKFLREIYKKWYKVDKNAFPKNDKIRFWLFRYLPPIYKLLYELNRKIKCKKK
ncbi:MAG: glycosyltransferase family 2 protein [Clostridia bacterium]|nr:glycosyltransferase family 2 protein [Clostridia bacterium]